MYSLLLIHWKLSVKFKIEDHLRPIDCKRPFYMSVVLVEVTFIKIGANRSVSPHIYQTIQWCFWWPSHQWCKSYPFHKYTKKVTRPLSCYNLLNFKQQVNFPVTCYCISIYVALYQIFQPLFEECTQYLYKYKEKKRSHWRDGF